VQMQVLHSNLMHIVDVGCLPPNVSALRDQILQGRFLVQVDGVWDISQTYESRQTPNGSSHRVLKFHLSDGIQHCVGIEYRRIPFLNARLPIGFKLVLRNVRVRHGILLLDCDAVEADLGGGGSSFAQVALTPSVVPRYSSDQTNTLKDADGRSFSAYNNYNDPTSEAVQPTEPLDYLGSFSSRYVVVLAAVTNTVPPFRCTSSGYHVCVKIDDGTSHQVVSLSDSLIAALLGGVPSSVFFMNSGNGPVGRAANSQALKRLEVSLATLQGIMVIDMGENGKTAVVVSISSPSLAKVRACLASS